MIAKGSAAAEVEEKLAAARSEFDSCHPRGCQVALLEIEAALWQREERDDRACDLLAEARRRQTELGAATPGEWRPRD